MHKRNLPLPVQGLGRTESRAASGPSIAIFPYKAAMWDSLESIWEAACRLPHAKVTVVPVPYYAKDPEGHLGELHWEGRDFPPEVPVADWREYDIEQERPDIAFVQNPYDAQNNITEVRREFQVIYMRPFAKNLIYVPYFVLPGAAPKMLMLTNGTVESDFTFVQGEAVKDFYLATLPQEVQLFAPKEERLLRMKWEKKIIPLGSPKVDKVQKEMQRQEKLPPLWEEKLGGRKAMLLNTNVNMILHGGVGFLANLRRIFKVFAAHKETWAVIWREHPLTMETIRSSVPQIESEYLKLRDEFAASSLGLIDETTDPYTAFHASDAYFGAGGSLSLLYAMTGKPLMQTVYNFPRSYSRKSVTLQKLLATQKGRLAALDRNVNSQALFLENLPAFSAMKEERLRCAGRLLANMDGSVGRKIMRFVMKHGKGLK